VFVATNKVGLVSENQCNSSYDHLEREKKSPAEIYFMIKTQAQ
jgi:hypothetical protein